MSKAIAFAFVGGIYVVLPIMMAWGWVRWVKRREPQNAFSRFSLVGFTLGTASGLLAISSMVYAHAVRGFSYYDPSLLRIYRGALLSVVGVIFAVIGVRRPNSLRWLAPMCAVGTLVFWLAAAMGE
jgi:hypothetical protein